MAEAVRHTTAEEQQIVDALMLHDQRKARPADFPFDDLNFTLGQAAATIGQMANDRASERDEVAKLSRALRQKDEAMGVLFQRMRDAGVDYSDLIP
ncbi:hypothetical protein O9Z70_06235 [Devosia sp. YIM 151766]|uniref:hypothetical protein n=1 Tax=Devosia sp. YIM 151766 TaxID=3017325 RepID=UPI00255C6844|nr:hypothetical protein [Devosia sp. YIM 151766]WIY54115.1 hypothetical protein O9Z70_06235 [Devosia sp. YIM 151766]